MHVIDIISNFDIIKNLLKMLDENQLIQYNV